MQCSPWDYAFPILGPIDPCAQNLPWQAVTAAAVPRIPEACIPPQAPPPRALRSICQWHGSLNPWCCLYNDVDWNLLLPLSTGTTTSSTSSCYMYNSDVEEFLFLSFLWYSMSLWSLFWHQPPNPESWWPPIGVGLGPDFGKLQLFICQLFVLIVVGLGCSTSWLTNDSLSSCHLPDLPSCGRRSVSWYTLDGCGCPAAV